MEAAPEEREHDAAAANGAGRVAPASPSPRHKSNAMARMLLARDLASVRAALEARSDTSLGQIVSVALAAGGEEGEGAEAGADDGTALFHWRVEAKGGTGTVFEGVLLRIDCPPVPQPAHPTHSSRPPSS